MITTTVPIFQDLFFRSNGTNVICNCISSGSVVYFLEAILLGRLSDIVVKFLLSDAVEKLENFYLIFYLAAILWISIYTKCTLMVIILFRSLNRQNKNHE